MWFDALETSADFLVSSCLSEVTRLKWSERLLQQNVCTTGQG